MTSDGDAVSAETVDGVSLPSVGASATPVLTEGESVTEFTSAVTASVAAGCEMTDCSFALQQVQRSHLALWILRTVCARSERNQGRPSTESPVRTALAGAGDSLGHRSRRCDSDDHHAAGDHGVLNGTQAIERSVTESCSLWESAWACPFRDAPAAPVDTLPRQWAPVTALAGADRHARSCPAGSSHTCMSAGLLLSVVWFLSVSPSRT